jgi:probable H4MPT-linked C1 transfer pathway protein
MTTLGLDIGGANLKGAHRAGLALSEQFELWKAPARLPAALAAFFLKFPPFDCVAVTMTGELCDCFATKREGVGRILEAVEQAAPGRRIKVWQTTGRFTDPERARDSPLETSAANWHAMATWAGRQVPAGSALLIDVGSTTSDVIPIRDGKPIPAGLTDRQRLKSRELVYTGVTRTPVCALLGGDGAAEWFATTLDLYLVLSKIPEEPANCATADGRPATVPNAHARLARMWCADIETCTLSDVTNLARELELRQARLLRNAIDQVASSLSDPLTACILTGSGEFLAQTSLDLPPRIPARVISLSCTLGPEASRAACAYALAVLAEE